MLPKILDHAKMHNIRPNKSLGQNFILDINFCKSFILHEKISDKIVLEIGPGLGTLTRAILSYEPFKLVCLEKDAKCIPILKEIALVHPNLEFEEADVMKYLMHYKQNPLNFKFDSIISNLPYNIASRVLVDLIEIIVLGASIKSITIMVQKEVADRILGLPNSKNYGLLTVLVNSVCNVTRIVNVGPQMFYPVPNVTSTVINLTPKNDIIDSKLFNQIKILAKNGFNQRRKILKSSMKDFIKFIPENLWLLRAENLTGEDYKNIAINSLNIIQFDKNLNSM